MGERTRFVGKRRNKAESTSEDDIGGFWRGKKAVLMWRTEIKWLSGERMEAWKKRKRFPRRENVRRERRDGRAREEVRERAVK